jgi:hypothetical protein
MNLLGKTGKAITGVDLDFSEYGFGRDSETIARGAELIKEAAANGHTGAADTLNLMALEAMDREGMGQTFCRSYFDNSDLVFREALCCAKDDKLAAPTLDTRSLVTTVVHEVRLADMCP